MESNLEQFIARNRVAFDTYEPPAGLWQDICDELDAPAQQTPAPAKGRILRLHPAVWQVAAAVAFVIGAWVVLQQPMPSGTHLTGDIFNALGTSDGAVLELRGVAPGLAREAQTKVTRIKELNREVQARYRELSPAAQADLRSELARLDAEYRVLAKEYHALNPNDSLAAAMVSNLQQRIDLLQRHAGAKR